MTNHATTASRILLARATAGHDVRLPTKIRRSKRSGKISSRGVLRCGLTARQVAAILDR